MKDSRKKDASFEMSERIERLALGVVLGIVVTYLIVAIVGRFQPGSSVASAQGAIDWPTIALTETVNGLSQPLHVTNAGDGSGRLFVVEKVGVIRIVDGGGLVATPFLSITNRIEDDGNEQGLFSVAFPPDYASKGYFYVDYTDLAGDTVVSRFDVTADPDVADPNSEEIILTVDQPGGNHNGGQLAFGPDGYLYISLGDGGGAGDTYGNAQDPSTLLGNILRIDVEPPSLSFSVTQRLYLPMIPVSGGTGRNYEIPSTNPFTQTAGYRDEIWAWGLRNPWRFSFDRSTGDLYIGDVGQASYEEIDFQPAASAGGENYGWNTMEGFHCYPSDPCDETGLVLPAVEYPHTGAAPCFSVTGGVVYRGSDPDLQGVYFYGDYCDGRIWGLVEGGGSWSTQVLTDTDLWISSFGEDEAGNVYFTDIWGGKLYQLGD